MTRLQFRRWYGFAIRMARRGFPRMTNNKRQQIEEWIQDFFRDIKDDEEWYSKKCPPGMVERIKDWDHSDHAGIGQWETLYGVGDRATIFMESKNPHRWEHTESQYKRWEESWGNKFKCCIRAGLDMAGAPSGGVVGFTVGDLRRMYRGNIPSWVFSDLETKKGKPVDLNSTRIKDLEEVWL